MLLSIKERVGVTPFMYEAVNPPTEPPAMERKKRFSRKPKYDKRVRVAIEVRNVKK